MRGLPLSRALWKGWREVIRPGLHNRNLLGVHVLTRTASPLARRCVSSHCLPRSVVTRLRPVRTNTVASFSRLRTPPSWLGYRALHRVVYCYVKPRRLVQTSGLFVFAAGCYLFHIKLSAPSSTQAFCHSTSVPDTEAYTQLATESTFDIEKKLGLFERLRLSLRLVYLCVLFSPAVLLYCLSYVSGNSHLAALGWRYTFVAIQLAGPAFVKLGQWASTRRDLFSENFCSTLSQLHMCCDSHPWRETVKTLEENFGKEWEEELVIVDRQPIGSGCVAQVYRGYLNTDMLGTDSSPVKHQKRRLTATAPSLKASESVRPSPSTLGSAEDQPIAVKVLHPGIVDAMETDIRLMQYVADWVDTVYPDVHWVALKECVDEFSKVMWKQLDLELEARNLKRFQELMRSYGNIKFPTPIPPFVTRSVLVESFEPGAHISEFLDNPGGALQKKMALIGVEAVLNMLFIHNFVHGDLHPGNILVQDPSLEDPKLVIVDCGIATSLGPIDLENFKGVFTAIIKGEGVKVADLFLGSQPCATVEEYRRSMAELVDRGRQHLKVKEIDVADLFSNLFNILIEHKVRIEPNYTSVMAAVMVIEGLGRSLDPSLNILTVAAPCLLQAARQSLSFKRYRKADTA